MKIRSWLQFFRLPNLPTAPGDALAGAAFLLQDGAGGFAQAVAAGAAALGIYMFGLADNDIVGVDADSQGRSDRPLARGDISIFQNIPFFKFYLFYFKNILIFYFE